MHKAVKKIDPKVLTAVAGLFALSFALRIYKLNMGFWVDEIITMVDFARKPWLKIITEVPIPNNHILYTLLAKLSVTIFGEHEWSARLPSMIIGSLMPPVSCLLFRKKFSEFAAFSAGLFMALNYWAVWFSQDARGYAGLILFSLLGTCAFLSYLENRNWKNALAYIFCAGISVQFHLYGIFIVGAHLLWALISLRNKKADARAVFLTLAALGLGIAIYLPGAGQLYQYGAGEAHEIGERGVNLGLFKNLVMMLAGTRNWPVGILVFALVLPGLFRALKRCPGFIVIYLSAGLGIIFASLIARVFIYPRFLIFMLPPFSVALALTLEMPGDFISRKNMQTASRILAAVIITALLIPGLVDYYRLGKQGFKDAAAYIRSSHPQSRVIAYGDIGLWFAYYYPGAIPVAKRDRLSPELIQNRLIISSMTGWQDYNIGIIEMYCHPEKIWPSAGDKAYILILYNCSS